MRGPTAAARLLVAAAWVALSGCGKVESSRRGEALLVVSVRENMTFAPARFECRAGQNVRFQVFNGAPAGSGLLHNVVVLEAGLNVDAFAQAVVDAAPEDNYIPRAISGSVLAAGALVPAGGTGELAFTAPSKPGSYPVVCSFPGHCILGMRAELIVLP